MNHECVDALGKTDRSQWTVNAYDRTVYRAQEGPLDSRYPFFSTTTSKRVASEEFTGDVYEIHLLSGVRVLDVNAILGDTRMKGENEIIVDGGGVFTKVRGNMYTYGPALPKAAPPPVVDLDDIDDPEFLELVAKAEARQNGSRRTRRTKRRQNAVRSSARSRKGKARSRRR